MHILITGAAGMIGRKLTERLAKDGGLNGRPIDKLTLLDVVQPTAPAGFSGKADPVAADLAAPGEAASAAEGTACSLVFASRGNGRFFRPSHQISSRFAIGKTMNSA